MIILTGGAGFIGSCFLKKLNDEGIDDILVVDSLGQDDTWQNLLGKRFRDYVQKDEFLRLVEADRLGKPERVIHLGACSSTILTDADHYLRNNYEFSKIVATWALRRGAVFMYASSAATYGDGAQGYDDSDALAPSLRPLNMYGYSKHLFDLWLIASRQTERVTGFKYFNVFGPNEYHKGEMRSVICKKYAEVAAGAPLRLFKSYHPEYPDGGQRRDFVYIKDVLEVMWFFYRHPDRTGIFNLGTGQARSWNDLAGALFAALGRPPAIEYIDMPESLRPKYQYFTQARLDKLRAAGCDHSFMSLENAVKDYAGYLATGARY